MESGQTCRIGRGGRAAWLAVNLLFGLAPTALFFAWVEQDTALPWLPEKLGWPWLTPDLAHPGSKLLCNLAPFVLFAVCHTYFAQVGVQERLKEWVPGPAVRSVYLAVSGVALLVMMALWQPTGIAVWQLSLPGVGGPVAAGLLFAAPMAIILLLVARLGFWEFLGWSQLLGGAREAERTAGTPALRTTGIYGWVRHPIYSCLLLLFVLGPTLSLDRLALFVAAASYLAVGIPVEERKLIRLFGDDYVRYRRRVPALVPLGKWGAATAAQASLDDEPSTPAR